MSKEGVSEPHVQRRQGHQTRIVSEGEAEHFRLGLGGGRRSLQVESTFFAGWVLRGRGKGFGDGDGVGDGAAGTGTRETVVGKEDAGSVVGVKSGERVGGDPGRGGRESS